MYGLPQLYFPIGCASGIRDCKRNLSVFSLTTVRHIRIMPDSRIVSYLKYGTSLVHFLYTGIGKHLYERYRTERVKFIFDKVEENFLFRVYDFRPKKWKNRRTPSRTICIEQPTRCKTVTKCFVHCGFFNLAGLHSPNRL